MPQPRFIFTLTFCLFIGGSSWPACAASMTPDQFQDFFANYYRHPQPERLEAALEFFVRDSVPASGCTGDLPPQKSGRAEVARFFAVLAPSHPEILQKAGALFDQSDWEHKAALLEVFKRVEDENLDARLSRWSKLEDNDDRRIALEQAKIKLFPGLAVLQQPLLDPDVLTEQWACFFALGNTQAANTVLGLLAGSGNMTAPSGTTPAATEAYPPAAGDAATADAAWHDLEQHSRQHPAIEDLATQELFRGHPENFRIRLADMLVRQVLQLRSAPAGQRLVPVLEKLWAANPAQLKFFLGALAVLNGQDEAAANYRSQLMTEQPVLAERLSGYRAWSEYMSALPSRTPGPAQGDGQALARQCAGVMSTSLGYRTYGVLDLWRYRPGCRPDASVSQLATLVLDPEVFFTWQNAGPREEAWRHSAGQAFLWNQATGVWTPVYSSMLRAQQRRMSGSETLVQILSQQRPDLLAPIPTGSGNIWQLQFTLSDVQGLIDPRWESGLQPDSRYGTLKVCLQEETHRVLCTQLTYVAARGATPCARFTLNRIYYDYAAQDLKRWQEMK